MARKNRQISLFLAAAILAAVFGGCRPATGNETSGAPETPASSDAAASGQDASQAASPAATRGPCPDYDQAMADATGAGYPDSAWQSMGTDEATCLQNAYALAAALYHKDAAAAAAACGYTGLPYAEGKHTTIDDQFPFETLDGLAVNGFSFSGGTDEPLWMTISVTDAGNTPLPVGETTYALEFGNGYYVTSGCVSAMIPQEYYRAQEEDALTYVRTFRSWVTARPWANPNDLPNVTTAYYVASFAAMRGAPTDAGGVWKASDLAAQARDAFGTELYAFEDPYEAAFTQEGWGSVYDGETDTFQLAASPGDGNRNCRMTGFTENASAGTWTLTMARGTNSLWMEPYQSVAYTLRQNGDGSWAILYADWAGGSKVTDYAMWETSVRLPDGSALPERLPLRVDLGEQMTWQQASDALDMDVSELQALNPDVQPDEDGTFLACDLLVDTDYALPDSLQRVVLIENPWEDYQGSRSYCVPASLDEEESIVTAEALDFLWHFSVRTGYFPAQPVENDKNAELYQAVDGARFTKYSELKAYLDSVFTPELAAQYADGGYNAEYRCYTGYMAGENDELRFGGGERGTNPLVLTQLCTGPQTQPDGSLVFGLLGIESSEAAGTGAPPARAVWHTIRLVKTDDGWRVAEASLAV